MNHIRLHSSTAMPSNSLKSGNGTPTLSPGPTSPNIFPIVYNGAIANNLKPIGTFLSKRNRNHPYNIFELFAYLSETVLILSSDKMFKTVVMNLHIIGNTFVNIRINSHTLHFHHYDWFKIVRDC